MCGLYYNVLAAPSSRSRPSLSLILMALVGLEDVQEPSGYL